MGYWVAKETRKGSRYMPSHREFFFRVSMEELKPITKEELLEAASRFKISIPENPTESDLYKVASEIHNSIYGAEFASADGFPYRKAKICLSEERKKELPLDLF
ncbi:hypothetical protein [Bernardetia sp.]|uniref:hypothetical protein n=1 Tax=Bernardetia sp. TaxID=1937974 RepID=UPI0025B8D3F8|nr:hypothetical protein [Bernardetia sp.]